MEQNPERIKISIVGQPHVHSLRSSDSKSQALSTFLLCWLWFGTTVTKLAAATMVIHGCPDRVCGDVSIPYPFGIGTGCSMSKSFEVYCNNSFRPPKPYLTSIQMELTGISLTGYARINTQVISSHCIKKAASPVAGVDLSGSAFRFSEEYNRFTATGCDNYAKIVTNGSTVGQCLSACNRSNTSIAAGCNGQMCCQTTIPPGLVSFKANMKQGRHSKDRSRCTTSFMVDQSWLDERQKRSESFVGELSNLTYVPTIAQWGKYQGFCAISEPSEASFCSDNGYCWNPVGDRHLCVCSNREANNGKLSNSYITQDCPEGDTCMDPNAYDCHLLCMFNPGLGGESCSCPSGYDQAGDLCSYEEPSSSSSKSNRTKTILIGCASGLGSPLLVLGLWVLYKKIKQQRESRLKQKYFKRNGGLLFKQQLGSTESNIKPAKIFASKDLEKATDNYHIGRIIGRGGQGTVYKGMLTDGTTVAIKKSQLKDESKDSDESKVSEFISEVVILSQINHRNIVQLLGCCLEAEVPLLVYEYIPNGTLEQYLHNENEEEYLAIWKMRLQIATEVANALTYLHSAAVRPIYHRDIKSANILLDERYRAKVADFGVSRVIAVDQTHATTRVAGTIGYMDPEYYNSGICTDKSDVFSFGVVLAELLTGQKAISASRPDDERSLRIYFLRAMDDNRLSEIVDARVAKEGVKEEEIAAVAQLARACLNMSGGERPTMKTVAIELERIRANQGTHPVAQQDREQADVAGPSNSASSSWISSFDVTKPLLASILELEIEEEEL